MIQTVPIGVTDDPAPSPDPASRPAPASLLPFAGEARNALVVAERPAALLCALIRLGCPAALSIRPGSNPDGDGYDLMLLAEAAEIGAPAVIVSRANRWLGAGGRLIIGHIGPAMRRALVPRLRVNGFVIIDAPTGGTTLCAERRRAVS